MCVETTTRKDNKAQQKRPIVLDAMGRAKNRPKAQQTGQPPNADGAGHAHCLRGCVVVNPRILPLTGDHS